MADDECRRHADIHLLALELTLHHLLRLLGDRHQSVDKQTGDARNELHHGTHGDTQEEYRLGNTHHSIGGGVEASGIG